MQQTRQMRPAPTTLPTTIPAIAPPLREELLPPLLGGGIVPVEGVEEADVAAGAEVGVGGAEVGVAAEVGAAAVGAAVDEDTAARLSP